MLFRSLGESAREGLLKNVLREIAPTESTLQEAQELAVVVHEYALHVGVVWSDAIVSRRPTAHTEAQGPAGTGRPRVFSSSFAYAVNLLSVGCWQTPAAVITVTHFTR